MADQPVDNGHDTLHDTVRDTGHEAGDDAPRSDDGPGSAEDVVREMVREDRAANPDRPRAATASADAVEALRRAMRDLKHDVRMLKVGLDKQTNLLEYVATRLERGGNPGDD